MGKIKLMRALVVPVKNTTNDFEETDYTKIEQVAELFEGKKRIQGKRHLVVFKDSRTVLIYEKEPEEPKTPEQTG